MAVGAALATLITQIMVMFGQIYLVKIEMNILNKMEEYIKPLIFALLAVLIFYLVSKIFLYSWIYNLVVSTIFCLLLSFILKIFDKQEIISLLKRDKN